jgi:hypothetical protein
MAARLRSVLLTRLGASGPARLALRAADGDVESAAELWALLIQRAVPVTVGEPDPASDCDRESKDLASGGRASTTGRVLCQGDGAPVRPGLLAIVGLGHVREA